MKSATASKREVAVAFRAAKHQAQTLEQLLPVIEQLAGDSEVSKGILSRGFLGRLRWLVLGR